MYLALLPSKDSEAAIRAALPQCGELHLTIIHSQIAYFKNDNVVESYWRDIVGGSLAEEVESLKAFGPPKAQVLALKLRERHAQGSDLFSLRHVAEECLQRAKIAWSKQWDFSPHITLGKRDLFPKSDASVLAAFAAIALPQQITFDRLEWRS